MLHVSRWEVFSDIKKRINMLLLSVEVACLLGIQNEIQAVSVELRIHRRLVKYVFLCERTVRQASFFSYFTVMLEPGGPHYDNCSCSLNLFVAISPYLSALDLCNSPV